MIEREKDRPYYCLIKFETPNKIRVSYLSYDNVLDSYNAAVYKNIRVPFPDKWNNSASRHEVQTTNRLHFSEIRARSRIRVVPRLVYHDAWGVRRFKPVSM